MATGKNTIVVYRDWKSIFDKLTDEEAGQLIKHIFRYINQQLPKAPNRIIEVAFISIKMDIDRDFNKAHIGKNHWNWKNGITPLNKSIRNSQEIKQWRKNVFERDKYICRVCGAKNTNIHAHHILPFSTYKDLRLDIDNGITLCVNCHISLHSKKNKNGRRLDKTT